MYTLLYVHFTSPLMCPRVYFHSHIFSTASHSMSTHLIEWLGRNSYVKCCCYINKLLSCFVYLLQLHTALVMLNCTCNMMEICFGPPLVFFFLNSINRSDNSESFINFLFFIQVLFPKQTCLQKIANLHSKAIMIGYFFIVWIKIWIFKSTSQHCVEKCY